MAVECVIKNAAKSVGEGPHWDDVTNTLLYVDIQENAIRRYCPESKENSTIQLDDTVGFVVPARKGGLIAGVGRCLVHVDGDSKKVTKLHEVDHGLQTRFNDGKCDPQGRVWAGTMGPVEPDVVNMPKIGSLYRLDLDGSLHTMVKDVGVSNGLAWTADDKFMFYIDSTPRQIYRYDFEKSTGNISNKKVIVDSAGKPINDYGFPDGMTIDTEGKLWVACFSASKVIRYDPETGHQLQSIYIPSASRITSCCFGGKNLDELYVTCSAHEVPPEEFEKYPLSGSVFRVTQLGVKGRKAHVYEGEIKALNK
ncbi:regucalcin-like [Crassostrea angulata]|uniref:regucalcin-like n=1 Tax=Magallana angulata TaxID=2784310 RepID=UPI0022B09955|nr:regucalcin-like [Crassostrea angulata]